MAKLTAVFDVKDRISKRIKGVTNSLRGLNRVKSSPTIRAKDQATRQVDQVSRRLSILNRVSSLPIMRIRDLATKTYDKVKSKLTSFAKMSFSATLTVHDKVSSAIGQIKQKIFSLKGLAVTVGAALVTGAVGNATVGAASTLEQQQISMNHFMGKGNQGLSADEVKTMADTYLADLRANANLTPFETNEVIGGGTRALQVAQGDPKQAMKLLTIAEDMAALNPGKSLSDAMEAIADLNVGETERMKEFGFKISQDDIKNAGGIGKVIDGQIAPFFEGGAQKLSESAAGLLSTVTGSLKSSFQDMGVGALEAIKPTLEKIASFVSGGGLTKFTETGSKLLETLFKTGVTVFEGLIPHFMKFQEWMNSESGTDAINNFITKFGEFSSTVASKFLTAIQYVVENWDTIEEKLRGGAEIIGNVLSTIGTYLGKFIDWWNELGPVGKNTVGILAAIGVGLQVLAPFMVGLFYAGKNLLAIFTPLGKLLGSLAKRFWQLAGGKDGVIKGFKTLIQMGAKLIGGVFKGLWNGVLAIGRGFLVLGRWLKPVIPWFLNLLKVGARFIPVIGQIVTVATLLWLAFKNWDKITEIGKGVFEYLQTNIPIWLENTKQWAIQKLIEMAVGFALWFESVRQTVTEKMEAAKEKVAEFFSPLFDFIESSKTKFDDFKSKLSEVVDTVSEKLISAKESVSEFFSPLLGFLDSAKTKWDNFKEAVSGFSMPKIGLPKFMGGNGLIQLDGSHRSGLNRVPFDGYVAQLHKDEAVLPRQEAELYRKGSEGESFVNAIGKGNKNNDSILSRVTSSVDSGKMTPEIKITIDKLIEKAEIKNEADEDRLVKKILKALEDLLKSEDGTTGDGVYGQI